MIRAKILLRPLIHPVDIDRLTNKLHDELVASPQRPTDEGAPDVLRLNT